MLNPTCTLYFHELKWSRTNWRSSSGPSTPGLLPFFFRGQPHQTISPEEVTVHVNMTDRCTIKAAMVMCKSAACRAAAEHSLEAFLWSDILQTKQLLQGSYWRTKLPLLINCPSAHTWCRTKQESIRLLKGLFSKNHSALLDWVCSPSLLLTSSVTDYWRLVCVWTTWSRPSDPTNPASLLPLLWRGGQPSRCSAWKTCDRFKSCCDAAVMETLFQLVVFVFQGARVVVSRSFADFTPQATFDIKVGTNENH